MTTRGARSASGGAQVPASATTWSPERMSLTSDASRGTRRRGCRDARRTGSACRTSGRRRPPRRRCRERAGPWRPSSLAARDSSSTSATSTTLGTLRSAASRPRAISGTSAAGDAEGDADAGVRRLAVGGERVVPPATADRLEELEADHVDLEDRAGVVVQAARQAEAGLHLERGRCAGPCSPRPQRPARRGRCRAARCSTPSACTRSTKDVSVVVIVASSRHCPAWSCGEAGVGDEQLGHLVGRELVELVDERDHRGRVGRTDAAVEALDQLAVVDPEPQRRQRQCRQRLQPSPGPPRRRSGTAGRPSSPRRCRPG